MPVPSAITDLSQTEGSNSPPGSESPTTADNYIRNVYSYIAMLRDGKGFTDPVQLASAATTSIGAQNALCVEITGTTTITSFGTTYEGPRFLRFTGALTLTHNSTTLNLPGAANITTAAGDTAIAIPNFAGNGWNVVQFQRADGTLSGTLAISGGGTGATSGASAIANLFGTRADVASAATVDLSSTVSSINITGTTTITAFTIAAGRVIFVRFNASLTLTNNASIVTQSGANIITRAGDTCILVATASNTVSVQNYTRANPIALQTSVATTSGTSVDVTGIPADANRVTINVSGLSTSGTSPPQLQLGNGSVVTTGYLGSNTLVSNAATTAALFTAGFGIGVNTSSWAGTVVVHGSIVLNRQSGNTWVCDGAVARSDVAGIYSTSGAIALGSALDRIRLTTAGGAETFDAGSISVSWE